MQKILFLLLHTEMPVQMQFLYREMQFLVSAALRNKIFKIEEEISSFYEVLILKCQPCFSTVQRAIGPDPGY